MTDLREGVVIARHPAVGRAFAENAGIEADVARVGVGEAFGRAFLHLDGAGVDRLGEAPLETAGAAITVEAALVLSDSGDVAAEGAGAGSAGLLIIDAEIRVIGEKVELIAERWDHGAGEVGGVG